MRPGSPDAGRLGASLQRGRPDSLVDRWAPGPASRLSYEQRVELAAPVGKGPEVPHGVVGWRRIELKKHQGSLRQSYDGFWVTGLIKRRFAASFR